MILTLAILSFLIVLTLFILDTSRDQIVTSEVSTYLEPFAAETVVRHNYGAKPESVWSALTKLSSYNFWFPGVLRILPDVNTERYAHRYSFDKFDLSPGATVRLRPFSLSPTFSGRILSVENQKQLAFEMRFNPFHKETVVFRLDPIPDGTAVTCKRTSRGLFSWMTLWGFNTHKSKILDNLGYFIPEEILDQKQGQDSSKDVGPQYSREAIIARAVQAGLDGNMDLVNAIPDKPTRGMAKAMLVQSKRKGNVMPDHLLSALAEKPKTAVPNTSETSADTSRGGTPPLPVGDDLIAYVVNKALDGDDEPLNAISDKPTRGKAKAMIVKIKRGSVERPAVPEVSGLDSGDVGLVATGESEEALIARLVDEGVGGNMEEINALDNKVLRGKIKAAVVKAKRAKK